VADDSTLDSPATGSETSPLPLRISNAISRVHKELAGRGPRNTRTTIDGDLVICVLEGGFTRAEQSLAANDDAALVSERRLALQEAMRPAMVAAVEHTIGGRVLTCMSGSDLARDLQVEVFVLVPQTPRAERD
jgi:uncharacterized protein YbcI